MNKTIKMILQAISYVITLLLGAAGGTKISQYACAVLLIVSSIVMVAYQVVHIDNVASGLLYYVAQSFLLAGSIFGLDQYLRIINKHYHENNNK